MLEGGKAGKDMFDKGELAAILRFGAQNLFQGEQQGDDGEAAPTAELQQQDQQLYEEDIDAILARAEVVDQRVQVWPALLRAGVYACIAAVLRLSLFVLLVGFYPAHVFASCNRFKKQVSAGGGGRKEKRPSECVQRCNIQK